MLVEHFIYITLVIGIGRIGGTRAEGDGFTRSLLVPAGVSSGTLTSLETPSGGGFTGSVQVSTGNLTGRQAIVPHFIGSATLVHVDQRLVLVRFLYIYEMYC